MGAGIQCLASAATESCTLLATFDASTLAVTDFGITLRHPLASKHIAWLAVIYRLRLRLRFHSALFSGD